MLAALPVRADDVCSAQEHASADAVLSRARAAESRGDLGAALNLADSSELRACGDGASAKALVRSASGQLGRKAEADGQLQAAFDYFIRGGWLDDASRVGLKQMAAEPSNFRLASDMMTFMRENGFSDGAGKIRGNAQQQAQQALAEEGRDFAVRSPRLDLLEKARNWLQLSDEPLTPIEQRALQRADAYLALDYAFAMEQALAYYEFAGHADKTEAVRAKARRLADQLADGDNWAAAVELYQIAGDSERADQLASQREAKAADTEKARKSEFQKEQDDLEKELGL
ncbi:MAG: hypothetical protein OEW92_06815 [Gammaproteobacteria bacterium]|nr:hypothetical protein [Gammaproteobacteria bacterium]MDH5172112.1 hypothetical protein [Gammaproteobacteria bacterium]